MVEPLNKENILAFLEVHKDELEQLGVKAIGLFGSFVRNEQTNKSDIDLLVDYKIGEKSFRNYMALVYYLEEAFGREVELVTRESLSKYIKPHIEKEVAYVSIAD